MRVLPIMIAPAASNRSTTVAFSSRTCPARILEPAVVGVPAKSSRSVRQHVKLRGNREKALVDDTLDHHFASADASKLEIGAQPVKDVCLWSSHDFFLFCFCVNNALLGYGFALLNQ